MVAGAWGGVMGSLHGCSTSVWEDEVLEMDGAMATHQ